MSFQILEQLSILVSKISGDPAQSKCLQKLPLLTIKFCNMIRKRRWNAMVNKLIRSISAQLPGAQALGTSGAVVIACKRFKV